MPSHTMTPAPTHRACIRTLQGEALLTAHRHRLALCGKRSSERAASTAAWEVLFHTMPPPSAILGMHAHSKENPGSLPTDTGSPFAVSDPASSPPTPQHGSAVSHRDPRPRPAGHAYARSRGKHSSLPTDTGSPFAVSDPLSTPPAPAAWGVPFSPSPVRALPRIRQSRPRTAAQSPAQ